LQQNPLGTLLNPLISEFLSMFSMTSVNYRIHQIKQATPNPVLID
jgi:hypothetical protein